MNNLDQVLDTQTESRPSLPVPDPEQPTKKQPFNKLNLDKVKVEKHDNTSLTGSAS